MAGHLSLEQIAHYGRGRVCFAELRSLEEHITECSDCRKRLIEARNPASAIYRGRNSSFDDGTHLTYEEIEAYVDRGPSGMDRRMADAHLLSCRTCADEVRDLERFKTELAESSENEKKIPVMGPRIAAIGLAAAILIAITVLWPGARKYKEEKASQAASQNQPSDSGLSADLAGLNIEEQSAVRHALEIRSVDIPGIAPQLAGKLEALRGSGHKNSALKILEPAGEVIPEEQPLFRWSAIDGAKSYSVAIYDANFTLIARSPDLHTTEWKIERPLERGVVYAWQLTAHMKNGGSVVAPGKGEPEARFKLLSEERAGEIERYAQTHPSAHLVVAILYAREGALNSGLRELEQIPPQSPDSGIAQILRSQIEKARILR